MVGQCRLGTVIDRLPPTNNTNNTKDDNKNNKNSNNSSEFDNQNSLQL